jgi:hypothetical protein
MLKDKLKRTLIRNELSAKMLFAYYRIANGNAAAKASEQRRPLDLFDYKALTADIPYAPHEVVIDNNLYGQAFSLKRYAGITHDLQAYIEHGLFWGGMVHQDEYHWYTPKIITFSEQRRRDIVAKGIEKETVAIGPYIHYAKLLFGDEELQKLRKELGKTLLVFPSKSILNIASKYDVDDFIQQVKHIGKDFKTIMVSLYYLDAQNKALTDAYLAQGFKIVTAGHRYDNYFLDRQRTFIELADLTMSNEVGTHVGYCIHLNKPHYIYQQKLERVGANAKKLARELTLYESDEDNRRNAEKKEVADAFSTLQNAITKVQREVIDKYWGTSSVKSPEELRSLFGNN